MFKIIGDKSIIILRNYINALKLFRRCRFREMYENHFRVALVTMLSGQSYLDTVHIFCWVSPNYERQEMNMGYLCWGMGEAALPTIVILKYLYQTLNSSATSCNCIHSSTIGCSAFIIYQEIRNILKCLNLAEKFGPQTLIRSIWMQSGSAQQSEHRIITVCTPLPQIL